MTGPILTEEVVIRIRTLAAEEAKRVLAAVTEQQKKQREESTKAVGEFQRLQAQVRQATADFRAGITMQDDYTKQMQRFRAEAIALRNSGLAPAGKELSAFSALMTATATNSDQATRVLHTMRNSLAQVAATTLGVSGRFGTLVSAALPLGISGTAALAVIAGTAAITKGIELAGKAAEEAEKQIQSLVDLGRSGEFGARIAQPLQVRRRIEIEAQLGAKKEVNVVNPDGSQGTVLRDLVTGEARTKLEDELRAVKGQLAGIGEELGAELGRLASTIAADVANLRAQIRAPGSAAAISAGARFSVGLGQKALADDAAKEQADILKGRLAIPTGRSGAQILGDEDDLMAHRAVLFGEQDAPQKGSDNASRAAQAASTALRSLALAAFSGRDALNVLAQGAAQSVQQLIGKQGGIFAGLFGGLAGGLLGAIAGKLVGGGSNGSLPVTITNADEIAKKTRTGPDKVSLTIQGSSGETRTVEYDLRKFTKLDGISRIPYGVPPAD